MGVSGLLAWGAARMGFGAAPQGSPAGAMRFTCAARTHAGMVRERNEDSYLVLAERGVFALADGMGGHEAGEVASEMAVRITTRELGDPRDLLDPEAGDRMQAAIGTANRAIFERAWEEQRRRGMGTTATVLVLRPGRYLIGHVGDSRAYLLRAGALRRLTRDHSAVQELLEAGLLTCDQARVHPCRRVITRCLGTSPEVVPDIQHGTATPGDVLLLASDGLTGMLEDDELMRILASGGGPERWVDRMIAETNRRGGFDNVTAIVVRIDSATSAS